MDYNSKVMHTRNKSVVSSDISSFYIPYVMKNLNKVDVFNKNNDSEIIFEDLKKEKN